MSSQLPPFPWRGRSATGWIALVAGLVVGIPFALALGLLLSVLGVAAWLVGVVLWLLGAATAWLWYAAQRRERIPYPFQLPPPDRRRRRLLAYSAEYLSLVPRAIGGVA